MPVRLTGLLLTLYFLTRVGSLNVLPMFLDEAVHLQWAERLYGEGRILRPLGAGRLLAVAAYGLAVPFEDRLWVARAVACAAGALTLLFTMLLSHGLFGHKTGLVAGLLYIFSPFALVYDRLALSDGFLGALITGLMWATWTLIQTPKRRSASALLAATLALAILAKVSALIFALSVPLAVFALAKEPRPAWRAVGRASALGLLLASPMLWFFAAHSGEISAQHLVDPTISGLPLLSTLEAMRDWALSYFTPPVLLFAVLSLLLLRDGRAVWLAGSVAVPFLLFAFFSQPWSARYVLPTLPPLLILVSGGIGALVGRLKSPMSAVAAFGLVVLLSWPGLSFDRALLKDPATAAFPRDDRLQLVSGWPAGYGVRELAERLKRESRLGALSVLVDTGGTRTVPTSLAILLGREPAIRLLATDFGSADFLTSITREMRNRRVFAVLGPRPSDLDFTTLVPGAAVERVEVYQRPGGEWAATLFRVRPLPDISPTVRGFSPVEGIALGSNP